MIEIRSSIFETNSSSVHVLVIPKDTSINVPHKVFLEGGEYGWSFGTECDALLRYLEILYSYYEKFR